jgi:hypothetical protein
MIKPGDILLYTGAGLLAWLLFRGARSQTKIWQESEEKQSQKKASDEVKRKAKEFQLSWKDSSGKTRTANLDTMAKFLEAALRGSWWGEDEDQIKAVMNAIPVSIKGKSGLSYPIVTIAARYAINTGGKDLKADLVRLLSQSELQSLGVLKHLKYL